jgi:hypothetical protein
VEQGNEKEAQELLAVLEWVADGDDKTATAKDAKPAAPAAPAKHAKTFTPAQALQIEEATALVQQASTNISLTTLIPLTPLNWSSVHTEIEHR